jgi:hypothetical protein
LIALLEDNFIQYDGTGEVPSQIHSYLSTNHKDLRNLDKSDPALDRQGKRPLVRARSEQGAGPGEEAREGAAERSSITYKASPGARLKSRVWKSCVPVSARRGQAKDYQTIINIANKLPEETLQEDEKLLTLYDMALTRTEDGI